MLSLHSRLAQLLLLSAALPLTACHRTSGSDGGGGGGSPVISPGSEGVALYLDVDRNGLANEGDEVWLRFDAPITLDGAQPEDLALAVAGDSFGAGASVAPGATPDVVRVVLGSTPRLKSRQRFDGGDTASNAASGVDVSANAAPGAIRATASGTPAAPNSNGPRDLVPGFVPGADLIDQNVVAAVLGDLDCDGVLDIVCARVVLVGKGGGDVTQICVHRGLGDGTYALEDTLGFTAVATALALGDVDRDGRLDVALGTEESDFVLRNDSVGPGAISVSVGFELSVQTITRALAFADLDSDGDDDLVAADVSNVRVYENVGAFAFADAADVLGAPATTEALAIGDIDEDGRLDLCLGQDGPNRVLLGTGGLEFVPGAALGTSDTRALALGDVDRDGDLDLLAGNALTDVLWRGDGAGGFELATPLAGATVTSAVALADVDGDATLDWLRVTAGELRIASGDGLGAFQDTGQALAAAGARTLPTGDVDGDGDIDALPAAGDLRVAQGSLSGTWGDQAFRITGIDIGLGRALTVELADWDGDGDLDLAQGFTGRIELRENLGDGTFGASIDLDTGFARVTDLVFGDVDRDGDQDLLAALIGADTGLWLQDGGSFAASPQFVPTSRPSTSIALDDIDGDGDLDYVLGTLRFANSEVMFNDGFTGDDPGDVWLGFVGPVQELGGELTNDVELVDLDCDGDVDLVAGNGFNEPDRIYLNDGGTFTLHQSIAMNNTRSVSLVDVDRDGDADLLRGTPQREELWLNDGAAGFTFAVDLGGQSTYAAIVRDLDGDGRPDLVIGNETSPGVRIFPGNGAGFDPQIIQRLNDVVVLSLAIGDLDRDGDPELVAPHGQESGLSRVYFTR